MKLAIAQNTQVKDPKALWKILEREAGQDVRLGDNTKVDKGALGLLKKKLTKSRVIEVK